jgi:hypothetical protein
MSEVNSRARYRYRVLTDAKLPLARVRTGASAPVLFS